MGLLFSGSRSDRVERPSHRFSTIGAARVWAAPAQLPMAVLAGGFWLPGPGRDPIGRVRFLPPLSFHLSLPLLNRFHGPALLFHGPGAVPGALELAARSEEQTSELQSRENLVCRLLLE